MRTASAGASVPPSARVVALPGAGGVLVVNTKPTKRQLSGLLSPDKARRQKQREAARHAKLLENLAKRFPGKFLPVSGGAP